VNFFSGPGQRPPPFPTGIPRDVVLLFEKLTFDVRAVGFTRYSADAILHQIRWHYQIERGIREFKCNDHWTATLARWFLKRHPHMKGFFELRVCKRGNEYDERPVRIAALPAAHRDPPL